MLPAIQIRVKPTLPITLDMNERTEDQRILRTLTKCKAAPITQLFLNAMNIMALSSVYVACTVQ
jgi:hypothetical protein